MTWLQGKGTDFRYMECSNIIQDWSTTIFALSVKRIKARHNGTTGNKMAAGQEHNGHEITHTFLQWQRKGSQRIWGGICS